MSIKDGSKDVRQRARRRGSFLAIIRSYLVVVVVFVAFLLFIGLVVVVERLILGWM